MENDLSKALSDTSMQLYTGEPLYPADQAKLDEVTEGVLWYADSGVGGKVYFHKLHIEKETPCGHWVSNPYCCNAVWRSKDSKKASKTRREALYSLFARKRSYVSHSKRRLAQAERQFNLADRAWKLACGHEDE